MTITIIMMLITHYYWKIVVASASREELMETRTNKARDLLRTTSLVARDDLLKQCSFCSMSTTQWASQRGHTHLSQCVVYIAMHWPCVRLGGIATATDQPVSRNRASGAASSTTSSSSRVLQIHTCTSSWTGFAKLAQASLLLSSTRLSASSASI